jgi:hypothetical protein
MTGILSWKVSALSSGIFEFTPLALMFFGDRKGVSFASLAGANRFGESSHCS